MFTAPPPTALPAPCPAHPRHPIRARLKKAEVDRGLCLPGGQSTLPHRSPSASKTVSACPVPSSGAAPSNQTRTALVAGLGANCKASAGSETFQVLKIWKVSGDAWPTALPCRASHHHRKRAVRDLAVHRDGPERVGGGPCREYRAADQAAQQERGERNGTVVGGRGGGVKHNRGAGVAAARRSDGRGGAPGKNGSSMSVTTTVSVPKTGVARGVGGAEGHFVRPAGKAEPLAGPPMRTAVPLVGAQLSVKEGLV